MGLAFSYPEEDYDAFDQSLDALLKSLNLGNDCTKTTRKSMRSMSFNGRDSEPVLKAWGSGKRIIKRSLSFNKKDKDLFHVEPKHTTKSPKTRKAHFEKEKKPSIKNTRFGPLPEKVNDPKHEAAVKLQKVYKSFRTRRQLADCAVLVEQRWWKLLDFAMLKMNSVSFFDIKKTESALSKWTRAKSRAAKVGKGLSKDEKARKLALQHWLEAIDPRHRYGHNLHFYYDQWLICESKQPFFYWLDVGEGKEVSLDDKCPRHKLQSQCIKYLGPKERDGYEVIVEDGKLMYKNSGKLLDSTEGSGDSKWIFVLSTLKTLYVGQKKKGVFQHSSFLAGGATSAAGRLEVQNGILKAIWPHSGHYRPTEENFQGFILYLKSKNVDLDNVKTSPIEDEEETGSKIESVFSSLASSMNASVNYDNGRNELEGSNEEVKAVDVRPKQRPASELILRRSKFRKDTLSLQLVKQTSSKWSSGTGPRISCVRDFPSEIRFRALEEVSLSPRPNPFKVWNVSGNMPSPIPRAANSSAGVAET